MSRAGSRDIFFEIANEERIGTRKYIWIHFVLNFLFTHHWKYQLARKKELSIPPIWGCCGPTGGSIFTPGQKNHPAFSEIAAKTHSPFGLFWRAILPVYHRPSKKAGWFFCPGVKIEPPVGPQQPQIGGIKSSFFLAN